MAAERAAGRPCTLEGANAAPHRSPVVGTNRKERRSRNSSGRWSTLIVVLAFRSCDHTACPPPADRSMPTRTHGIRRGFISASQRIHKRPCLPGEASCEESSKGASAGDTDWSSMWRAVDLKGATPQPHPFCGDRRVPRIPPPVYGGRRAPLSRGGCTSSLYAATSLACSLETVRVAPT